MDSCAQRTASTNRNLAGIQICRMCEELTNWHARFKVNSRTKVQTGEPATKPRLAEFIAAKRIYYVRTIGI